MTDRIVIVGAGQAGAALAAKLRALGFAGEVVMIGAEPVAPYQRPPLSKAYLLGQMGLDRLTLRAPEFWADSRIDLRLGQPVTAIDPVARMVRIGDEALPYGQLALTTGASPRRLPAAMGGDLGNVLCVRSLADADAMNPLFAPGARLVVIGGGYIGLEAAAVARKRGMDVTLVEAAPRILGRVASAETADLIRDLHLSHGVTIHEGVGLDRLLGDQVVTGVALADGRVIDADVVVVGIGVAPDVDLAAQAGLGLDNGIAVDAQGRSSDPAIWAAGDCASFPWLTGRLRLESVGNAIDMAELVAANMLGAGLDYTPKPWFWSDQFDAKLQIAGLGAGADHWVVRRGEGASVWAYAAGRLVAVEALNDARAYMVGKRLIEAGRSPDPAAVADTSVDLKALLA
ncbi:NAD(P)/FAD-dependent oxidoreductase [Paracoccus sp. p4-l81]|uniref:NAD(P)/FAD-dependent oxidoreductase n=1 Tax=Paracoccus sp. p4-l81 TaxID=3342806 RepID=UPI0035B81068